MSQHAFDPYFGKWFLHSRKLRDVTDPDCTEWLEFDGTNDVSPILGGLGNVELARFAYDPPFEGVTLRVFDPADDLWRIYYTSTRQNGPLPPPVEGRFENGTGVFGSDEVLAGRAIKVRFEWTGIATDSPRWQQSFSFDAGRTWVRNWITVSTREA